MPLRLDLATRSDTGRVRSRNEDSVTVAPDRGVLVVADGMGGHPGGDVASRLAADEALRHLSESNLGAGGGGGMAEAVRSADARVRSEAATDPERANMGTTLTALRVDAGSGRFEIGHVGDSRAYRWRGGELERLTRDDTWVQEQVEAGRMSEEEARHHPWSSVLSQAVGLDRPAVPTVVEGDIRAGDLYLLCSDGLNAMIDDARLAGILRRRGTDDLDALAESLVAAANERGGIDNITVGLLAVRPPG